MRARALVAFIAIGNIAHAGMPSLQLTDLAAFRLQSASFFAAGLLVSAAVVRWVWNSLAKDFPRLPRLTFGKACGVVVLWGLLFVLVLSMISGARELMTPDAWEKQGMTYKVRERTP